MFDRIGECYVDRKKSTFLDIFDELQGSRNVCVSRGIIGINKVFSRVLDLMVSAIAQSSLFYFQEVSDLSYFLA